MALDTGTKQNPSIWNIPHRSQFVLLILVRIAEPIAFSSLAPYLYYLIESFGYDDPSTISELGTIVLTVGPLAQAVTSVYWGVYADIYGRKITLCVGLFGAMVLVLMLGVSTNIYMAISARLFAGLLNGNMGVVRTMIAELVADHKEYQTKAFTILPLTMPVGYTLAPIIGGYFSNPVTSFPSLFGDSRLLARFPFLLPNVIIFLLLLITMILVLLFAKETLPSGQYVALPVDRDPFLKIGTVLTGCFGRNKNGYEQVPTDENAEAVDSDIDDNEVDTTPVNPRPSIRSVLTYRLKITLISFTMLFMHNSTFMQLYPIFLSTPHEDTAHKNLFLFGGGLGLSTSDVGLVMSVSGIVGIIIQLLVYSRVAEYLGNANTHKLALLVFPICYFLIPYLALLPNEIANEAKNLTLCGIMAGVFMIGRTFATPSFGVLVSNAAPSKHVMGTVHGLTQSAASAARCIGPLVIGSCYSLGVKMGMVGLAWFLMASIGVAEIVVAMNLKEWGSEEVERA